MALTTDPDDPRIGKPTENGQNEAYLVLSEEERAKGYVRPVRRSYVHVGKQPTGNVRDLTVAEKERFEAGKYGYVKYEEYPKDSERASVGRFWTAEQLKGGCGVLTTMATAFAETYARDPKFYGSTFCCGCGKHIAVDEFVWDGTDERVGS